MTYVNLLGDSIIDNKVYVNPGELSVKEHLEDQSGYVFNQIAVDGHTTDDVIENQSRCKCTIIKEFLCVSTLRTRTPVP